MPVKVNHNHLEMCWRKAGICLQNTTLLSCKRYFTPSLVMVCWSYQISCHHHYHQHWGRPECVKKNVIFYLLKKSYGNSNTSNSLSFICTIVHPYYIISMHIMHFYKPSHSFKNCLCLKQQFKMIYN